MAHGKFLCALDFRAFSFTITCEKRLLWTGSKNFNWRSLVNPCILRVLHLGLSQNFKAYDSSQRFPATFCPLYINRFLSHTPGQLLTFNELWFRDLGHEIFPENWHFFSPRNHRSLAMLRRKNTNCTLDGVETWSPFIIFFLMSWTTSGIAMLRELICMSGGNMI